MYTNGEILEYEIRYRPSDQTVERSKYQYKTSQGRDQELKTIEGLQPGVEYIFEVRFCENVSCIVLKVRYRDMVNESSL